MKENIKDFFDDNTEIPEIVNMKCGEAYNQILKESINVRHQKRFRKKYAAVIGIAAAVAIGFSVPVMAEYIPALRHAYQHYTNNVYTKSPQQKNNLEEYAENIGLFRQGEYADIQIDDVYFDGVDISFSYVLSTNDSELRKSSGITANAVIRLGDNLICSSEYEDNLIYKNEYIGFSLADDGNYYGTYSHHVSDLNITDTTELSVKLYNFEGRDAYTWVQDKNIKVIDEFGKESYDYAPLITKQFNEIYEFQCDVTPDDSNIKNYPVNETKNGVTLESIDVSPFRTTVNLKNIPEDDNHSMRVKDNNGNEYESILDSGEMFLLNGSGWEAPLKDTKSITIEIFRLDVDGFPTETSFTVPIEKGYREKYDVEYNKKEITYIPPIDEEENEEQYEEKLDIIRKSALENAEIFELNEKLYSDFEGINIAVTGSEIVYDFSDYDLTDMGEYELNTIKENHDEELALYLVDYEISNPSGKEKSFNFTGNRLYDENLNDAQLAIEPTYISVKDHGGKYRHMFDIGANETKQITIGFLVAKDQAENITYSIPDQYLTEYSNFDTILANSGSDSEKIKEYTDGYILMKVK